MRGIPKTLDDWIVAVSVAVVAYLVCWGVGYVVNLTAAGGGVSVVPTPGSWPMRGVYLACAVAVGWWAIRHQWGLTSSVRGTALFAAVVLAGVCTLSGAVAEMDRHDFLVRLPAGADETAALRAGHQACDWLAAHRWGRPAGPEHLESRAERRALRLMYRPPSRMTRSWHGANSTTRLLVYYVWQVNREQPGALTTSERLRLRYTELAWYELCPFQQWVHRPVGGSGD